MTTNPSATIAASVRRPTMRRRREPNRPDRPARSCRAATISVQVHLKSRSRSDNVGQVEAELTIGAVSDRTGVASSALRFYETEGLIHSSRSAGGQRRYARDTLRRISFIRVAQQVGLSLDEIKEALASLPDNRTPTARDWERLSTSWRPRIDHQIAMLERLRDRLHGCIGCGCLSLGFCRLLNPGDQAAARGPGPRYILDDD
jgi:MerR family transcriptional regulator, redox-sensitive transcriptional activator SoxR